MKFKNVFGKCTAFLVVTLGFTSSFAAGDLASPTSGSLEQKTSRLIQKTSQAVEQGKSDLVEAAAKKVSKALVRIHVVEARYTEGRSLKNEGSGSGVVISPDGYIVTNHHVAGDAVRLVCTMPTREEIPATLVGTDALADIAVIKLTPNRPRTFDYATFGNSDSLQVGDTVLAMGCPLSLSQSVTEGIVSNTQMTMPSLFWNAQFELDGENVGSIVRWIGHDAAIFPGNSGGPLVNLKGEVIGINEISLGLSGAIPGNLARQVADTLIKSPNHDVQRAFLGFMLQPVFKHEDHQQGVIVSDVVEDSPADKAGIKPGDRLLRVNGSATNVQFAEELPPLNLFIASLPIGKPVQVAIVRDEKELTKTVMPVRREKVQTHQREFKQWGLTGRNLSTWTAIEMSRKDKSGVLVTSVGTGSPSGQAKPAIQENDIILKVNSEAVNNMDALTSLTQRLTKGQPAPVPALVSFARRGEELMTVVSVGIQDLNDPGREVQTSWVPVATQVLTRELAEQLKVPDRTGVRVTQVYDGETYNGKSNFGLKTGDLVVALDGEPIQASEQHDTEVFPALIRQYPIGTEVTLTVLRGGKELKLKGKLPSRPLQPREMQRYQDHDFDFSVRDVAYIDRMTYRWEDHPAGVLVDSVEDGGWAALGRMSVGDLMMDINGKPVKTVADAKQILEGVKQAKATSVIIKVRRGVHTMFLEMEPTWKQDGA